MQMDAKLNKNAGQILKALNDVLMQKQKAGNDLLRQTQAINETQTQHIEQTDNIAVAIMLRAEAKEKLREAKRKQPKEKKQQKQQQK